MGARTRVLLPLGAPRIYRRAGIWCHLQLWVLREALAPAFTKAAAKWGHAPPFPGKDKVRGGLASGCTAGAHSLIGLYDPNISETRGCVSPQPGQVKGRRNRTPDPVVGQAQGVCRPLGQPTTWGGPMGLGPLDVFTTWIMTILKQKGLNSQI